MSGYCCLAHALADVEAPGEVGAAARWEAAEYARLVQAGQVERWCGSGALVMEDAER